MGDLTPVLVIVVLIAMNGIFVAAEFAIIGTPVASVERRAARGHRIARLVASILRDPRRQDQYIATAQLGITFASLGLGMYGEHVLAEWFGRLFSVFDTALWFPKHAAATVVAVALLTYLHIVLGEMVPKSLALQHAERTSLWITPPVMWVKTALYPLVIGLNSLGNLILRIFGVNRQAARHLGHTAEELEYLIAESQEGGALRADAGKLLQDLLRFTELTAGEVMVPRVQVVGIPLGASSSELGSLLRGSTYTRFPVYREDLDEIIGVVHVKELLPKLLNGARVDAADVQPAPFVPHTAEVDTVMAAMRRAQAQLAVVMDEYGGTAGIVTAKDLLDEVVGEVHEEVGRLSVIALDPQGRLRVAGTVRLEELGEHLGVDLEHEEVDTVGGLVLALLERPPTTGDIVHHSGLQIEVMEVDGHRVKTCLVIPAKPGGNSVDSPEHSS